MSTPVTGKILIIDDEEPLRNLLARIISLEGFLVEKAGTLKDGINILNQREIDVVMCDVKLPDGNGVDFVSELKRNFPICEVILITAFGNIRDGVTAIKNGAFDYVTKGNDNDHIIPLLHQAMAKVTRKKHEAVQIRGSASYTFPDILGRSPEITEAINLARKIAPTDSNVLLLGETGTGKEVFANAIHAASKRAGKAFVAINCSAFARDLLEGELFGHKAGAYTGATRDKKGLLELADGGTVFLDEVGEMHLDLQAKILRVIELGQFIKLGDVKTTKVNLRIIAATNRDLIKAVQDGQFRDDLFYRLNVFGIRLPALRDRIEDIPALANYFLHQFTTREKRQPMEISEGAMKLLQQYSWQGNLRELRNVMERAGILAESNTVFPEQLPFELQQQDTGSNKLSLASVEKSHIIRVLKHTQGNKTRTAECLGIGISTLYRKMEEYQIPK